MRRWGLLLVLALGGCDPPVGIEAQEVCENLCSCIYGLPSQIDQCVQVDCLPQLPPPTPQCIECADQNACADINACAAICFGAPKELP